MSKIMLIDAAHAEETRVAIMDGRQLEEFDFESRGRRQLRGNIYLAKVTRVEPSLQAAFVEYGGNRHGFLAFNEIHPDYYQIPVADREALMAELAAEADSDDDGAHEPAGETDEAGSLDANGDNGHGPDNGAENGSEAASDDDNGDSAPSSAEDRLRRKLMRRYKIQDVIKRRQILLVQVVKDERGAKGAALTTWLSLAGRYCVLMPNTAKGGGISRKITTATDRKRLKTVVQSLDVPQGMGLIVRTAGAKRTKAEIKRDYDYLLRLWETIRETTLNSTAPSLIYEEETLVRRAVRDMFDKDFDALLVEGEQGWREARDFMRMLMPSQAKKVQLYAGQAPLFAAYRVEDTLTHIHSPTVQLKSGGYIVIHQTEALVAIDVNSGRATKERNIEATALKTNLEAADEAARQLRLRDLAGLIVIDFIDMDEPKNNRAVEKRLKDALAVDRARIQMGKISTFGLMELSRQRRRLGVLEGATTVCDHCHGTGRVLSHETSALMALRAVDIEAVKGAGTVTLTLPTEVALYILNHKRDYLSRLQLRYGLFVAVAVDEDMAQDELRVDRTSTDETFVPPEAPRSDLPALPDLDDDLVEDDAEDEDEEGAGSESDTSEREDRSEEGRGRGGRRRRRRRGGRRDDGEAREDDAAHGTGNDDERTSDGGDDDGEDGNRRRRRGRRGGRRVREEGSRPSGMFTWVRGRTPSIEQPFVWFDPFDVARAARNDEDRDAGARRPRREERSNVQPQRAEADASPDVTSATPLPAEASQGTPAEEPRRRRVRRKTREQAPMPAEAVDTASPGDETFVMAEAAGVEDAALAADADTAADPLETGHEREQNGEPETAPEPVLETAGTSETFAPEPEAAKAEAAPTAAPAPDPNEITAPPSKPKRGWWRRG
ncbi:MAG: ribonuclease E/G [Brevundimonas sp.]|uniref:Rne/Rng family ribonuclease n=1 Tax=Brevundimonas sp. TaxID=1871086 RepID=UPI00391C3AA2